VANTLISSGPWAVVVMVALVVLGAVVSRVGGLGQEWPIVTAALRAAVQLAVVAFVITAILGSLPLTALFVAVMYAIASLTAGRRMTKDRSGWWAAVPVGIGSLPIVVVLVAIGIVPMKAIAVIPMAGILMGGAMTATAVSGRRALDELHIRHGEVEAALALGFNDRDAAMEVARPTGSLALLPALDQTRTVGLVTLPGAFVGMLLAGAKPIEAGVLQLFVLVALLAVQSIAIVGTLELIARGRITPVGR
jgi:putative ABC transport system permease protein